MKRWLSTSLTLGLAIAPAAALAQTYGNEGSKRAPRSDGSKMKASDGHATKGAGHGSNDEKTSGMKRFGKLDASGDGHISKMELRTGIGPLFDDWDYDTNDELVDLEIVHGMFDAWDVDGDDEIDEVEFENGKTMWLPDDASVYYGDFDLDGEHEVSLTEFATGFHTSDLSVYNLGAEAPLTSYELADAILAVYDDNRDGELSKKEWPLG